MQDITQQELRMREDDFIVSKTDPKGRITYGNRIFIEFSGYSENELLKRPHNVIRHPDMPRSVFRLLWKTLQQGREFFGFVKNQTQDNRFYWTFAHVTPSYDTGGKLLGYYSVRRCPKRSSIEAISPIYVKMKELENQQGNARESMDAAESFLNTHLESIGKSYNEFILSLEQ